MRPHQLALMLVLVLGLGSLQHPAALAQAPGCQSNDECKAGRICAEGVCKAPTMTCSVDVDCPGEQVCEQGTCTAVACAPPAPVPPTSTIAPAVEALGSLGFDRLGTVYKATVGGTVALGFDITRGEKLRTALMFVGHMNIVLDDETPQYSYLALAGRGERAMGTSGRASTLRFGAGLAYATDGEATDTGFAATVAVGMRFASGLGGYVAMDYLVFDREHGYDAARGSIAFGYVR